MKANRKQTRTRRAKDLRVPVHSCRQALRRNAHKAGRTCPPWCPRPWVLSPPQRPRCHRKRLSPLEYPLPWSAKRAFKILTVIDIFLQVGKKKKTLKKCKNVQRKGRDQHPASPHPQPPAFSFAQAFQAQGGACPLTPSGRDCAGAGRGLGRHPAPGRSRGSGTWGLQVGGNGSRYGTEGKPGWRLRVARPQLRPPWPPRELPREIPRRRSRARERVLRPHCRPGLSWKAPSSASRWRTSCEWREAVRRRGAGSGPERCTLRACGWVGGCVPGLAVNLRRGYREDFYS